LLLYNKVVENESENAIMSLPEEQPIPEQPAASEDTPAADQTPEKVEIYPEEPSLPEGFTPIDRSTRLPRSRRRRANRMLVPEGANERAALLSSLARRAVPSVEFFLFALFCGAVLGAAFLRDSQALLLLGILLAPLMTPWVGLTLAIQTGSLRFFFLTLGGLLIACVLVFFTGALAGLAGHLWLPLPLINANIYTHLWPESLFLVLLGAVLLTVSFVRSEQKPILPSIMLAYGLFLPLSAGGVGLGIGSTALWQDGAQVFAFYLAAAVLAGIITLAALRFRPIKTIGYLLPFLMVLVSLASVLIFSGLTTIIRDAIITTRRIDPLPTLPIVIVPSKTPTPTDTPTVAPTFTQTEPYTATTTPQPTPAYAVITSNSGGGALVYSEPGGGTVLTPLSNGIIVQVLPEIQTSADGRNWVRVIYNGTSGIVNGWVLTTVLTATTETPPIPATFTPTPAS
jgi:hypothetical protein